MVIIKLFMDMAVYKGLEIKRGSECVTSASVMRQLTKLYPGGLVSEKSFDDYYRKSNITFLSEKDTVFLFRSGGIGDVLFMLPIARFLKENFGCKVKIGTSPMYVDVLLNNPYVDKIVQMPFLLEELSNCEHHLMFEGLIEDSPEKSKKLHAVDLFLDHAGIEYGKVDSEKKIPYIYLAKEELGSFNKKFNRLKIGERKKIGIQIEASSPVRNFPLDKIINVMRELLDRDYFVFIFGGKRQTQVGGYISELFSKRENFISLISEKISLRESIQFASKMDLFIAPDSAFVHVAGGLGVPVIGLYGCFPSVLRMRYYKDSIGIDCGVSCAPGFIHGHNPCHKGLPSPCFSVIKPVDIMNAVDHLLGKKKIDLIYSRFNEFKDGQIINTPFNFIS